MCREVYDLNCNSWECTVKAYVIIIIIYMYIYIYICVVAVILIVTYCPPGCHTEFFIHNQISDKLNWSEFQYFASQSICVFPGVSDTSPVSFFKLHLDPSLVENTFRLTSDRSMFLTTGQLYILRVFCINCYES